MMPEGEYLYIIILTHSCLISEEEFMVMDNYGGGIFIIKFTYNTCSFTIISYDKLHT